MKSKVKIKEETIEGTRITLWKNIPKRVSKMSYNITLAKKGELFLSVSSRNKRDLDSMVSKFEDIVSWLLSIVSSKEED